MPVISRMARASALVLAGFGLTATTVAVPAHATTAPTSPDRAQDSRQLEKSVTQARRKRAPLRKRVDRRVRTAQGIAMNQRGDAYGYGAAGPHRFDCSGLVYYSYRKAGFKVPRTSRAQAGHARRIPKRAMRPGDLMFFHGSSGVYHVGVFLRWNRGRALMVHAPSTGKRVHVATPWTSRWFAGTLRRR